VRVNVVDAEATQINFHARYLLTDKGGVRYDKGFAVRHSPEIVDISLLDRQLHQQLLDIYRSSNEDLGIVESWAWMAGTA
jgi:hypothetical protein